MDALFPPLSYAEAHSGVSEIVSKLGLPLFLGEADRQPTVDAVRQQVGAYYSSLAKENKLDVLHAYDAVDKAELIDQAVAELFERLDDEYLYDDDEYLG